MGAGSEEFLTNLGDESRVLLLGGLAVIAHGLSRTTEDADVWLDSMLPVDDWITSLQTCLPNNEGIFFWDLLRKREVRSEGLAPVVEELGVLRIGGLDRYVDVFRKPNELEVGDFEAAWEVSEPHVGKLRLLDETFLIVSKENSGRDRDRADISFLETKLRDRYRKQLSMCGAHEAEGLFSRYLDHVTCSAALTNPDPAVQKLGLDGLRELAAGGNPFAIDALKKMPPDVSG